jgi:predicted short-subunit dehydrogenase-like oxidoreductase (DUF2520 family)
LKTINVIGCGRVGKTLARLWTQHETLQVESILNRSRASGEQAADFVGGGRAVGSCADMTPTDLVMISACDESIDACCADLCDAGVLKQGAVVFHCSGSLPSSILAPARNHGARIASIHPVKSFADPAAAAGAFPGTFCALEGDPEACEVLSDALSRCGAILFQVDPQRKTTYHAGTVFVCNYLVALMEVGLHCFERAGISRETATEILRPIVAGTVENLFTLGPAPALTGPIARGDASVVKRQCEALADWDETIYRIYQTLGRIAADLSAEQKTADPESLAEIRRLLEQ